MTTCGLDFGTSNSTIGVYHRGVEAMIPLEEDAEGEWQTTLPSALFFGQDTNEVRFGRDAIARYTQGESGRFMRSMKSLLGSSTMNERTEINNNLYTFDEIIGFFVNSLKYRAETYAGLEDGALQSVVMGRPVRFNDTNPELDRAAEAHLADIAKAAGFKQVSFQFEPIAAALDYERQVTSEELALIIDIGGGTADFTLIRLSPERQLQADRQSDLLGNHGVHIGGTDFDRVLSMAGVMPALGLGMSMLDRPEMEMPKHYYVDLATWHAIHLLYAPVVHRELRQLRTNISDRDKLDLLIELLQQRKGHHLASLVEAAKIKLSNEKTATVDLASLFDPDEGFMPEECVLTQAQLEATLRPNVDKIFAAVDETLIQAGLSTDAVNTIFTTGGSTALPMVKACINAKFPHARQIAGDLYNSVGNGLLMEAKKRYG